MFVAVDLPPDVKDELWRARADLQERIPAVRWVPRENLHLTLSFLGSVDDSQVIAVSGAIADAVSSMVDFPVSLDRLGACPSEARARVLWVGLSDPAGGLESLAGSVSGKLGAAAPAESRRFRSHVTLGRLAGPREVDLSGYHVAPLRFLVDRVVLFESRLGGGAPQYEGLATFPFRRRPRPPRDE